MKILIKKNVTVKIRKLYKRSSEIIKFPRQASALHRSRSPKQTLILEKSSFKELSSKRLIPTIVTYPIPGENIINHINYIEPNQNTGIGLVQINQAQYFENVPPKVWNYCVGNYCICQRWLKVREGTTLDHQSIQDYQRLVMLISETIDLISNVDSQLINS
jgi:hypothetical protein